MTFVLRDYQREAVDALARAPSLNLAVLPTGSGKSAVLGHVAAETPGRVLILAHVKELVLQDAAACRRAMPERHVGICASGLGKADTFRRVTVGMVQTLARRLGRIEPFDTVLVDEAHRIPHGSDGQYHAIFDWARSHNPDVRILGLTATPYRHPRGMLTSGEDRLFERIVHETRMDDLTARGFLSPIVARSGLSASIDTSGVKIAAGEYQTRGLGMAAMRTMHKAVPAIAHHMRDRRTVLVFAASVEHGEALAAALEPVMPGGVAMVDGESTPGQRADALRRFASGALRTVVNVGLWTTGLDVPGIDGIVLNRATMSRALFEQMVGRGTRLAPGKEHCLLLDLGGNVERFGGIGITGVDSTGTGGGGEAPVVVCRGDNTTSGEGCGAFSHSSATRCSGCGAVFLSSSKLRVGSFEGELDLTLARTRGDWVPILEATLTSGPHPKLVVTWAGGKARRTAGHAERAAGYTDALPGMWALVKGGVLHGIVKTQPESS